jgi:CheY-like chemotaxis protein
MCDVLVVGNQSHCLELVTSFLNSVGISAKSANSGETALANLKATQFKLLITDLNMSGMSGVDMAKKAIASVPGLSVILITAQGFDEVIESAKSAGIRHIITRPLCQEQLINAIDIATDGAVKANKEMYV